MSKDKKLGKGLNLLFGGKDDVPSDEVISVDRVNDGNEGSLKKQRLLELSLAQIYPNKEQPRKSFDEDAISKLAASIRTEGVVQPVLVRMKDNRYELISGERRWRAAQKAELKTIPAIVVDADENRSMQIALIENIQRQDLNPIEKAKAFLNIVNKTGCTQEELSERIGQDRSTLANFMRLLDLPVDIQEAVSRGTISMGHARTLLSVNGEKLQRELARKIEKEGISVRNLENIVKRLSRKSGKKTETSKDAGIAELEAKLTNFFGTKVTIETGRKRGRIVIDYYENRQLNDILAKLNIVV